MTATLTMPTYKVVDTDGRVLAEGLLSYSAALRLADSYTRRNLVLAFATPE